MGSWSKEMMAASLAQQVVIRSVERDAMMTVSLLLGGRVHRLRRSKDELVEKTLHRMALTTVKIAKKRDRKVDVAPPPVRLLDEDTKEVVEGLANLAAWRDGLTLYVGNENYCVKVNPPTVIKLEVPSCIMEGYPIVPRVELEFADLLQCQWVWWRLSTDNTEVLTGASTLDPSYLPSALSSAVSVGHTSIYTPTTNDIGNKLVLQCTPCAQTGGRGNPAYISVPTVQRGPVSEPIAHRHSRTPSVLSSPDELRVVSYNTLADLYSTGEYALNILYPYCEPEFLDIGYRQGLIVKELAGYHADIMCLQEVSVKFYETYLLPALSDVGYDGSHERKTGQMPEGEAILYLKQKYSLVSSFGFSLSQFLQEDPSCAELLAALQEAPSVLRSLGKKHTILQLVLLQVRDLPDHYILVGNTHLAFHPAEDHIRLYQTIISVRAIQKALKDFTAPRAHVKVGVVYGGDFNSCMCIGAYQFLTCGRVSRDHPDWTKYKYNLIPRCGCCKVPSNEPQYILNRLPSDAMEEEEQEEDMECVPLPDMPVTMPDTPWPAVIVKEPFSGLDVSHPFKFQDTCSPQPYTNYTAGFKAVLDYIFVDAEWFSVRGVVPVPTEEEVSQHTALPSQYLPSDHVALVCDLKWK